jgi:peptidoglycan/xylan/chitin deacetylase (PgdA/CDA1 family)
MDIRLLLRRSAQQLVEKVFTGGAILLYHRIGTAHIDPSHLQVSPHHFAEHMSILRRRARPCSLSTLHAAAERRQVKRGMVAVSFDDGYRDVKDKAHPILLQEAIPATFFIVASQLKSPHAFWWDELAHLVYLGPPLPMPPALTLQIGGREWSWPHIGLTAAPITDPQRRDILYRQIHDVLIALPEAIAVDTVNVLKARYSNPPEKDVGNRLLDVDDISALVQSEQFEIGSHGWTHTDVNLLSRPVLKAELASSRDFLSDVVGKPVSSLAYPFGCYGRTSARLAAEAGYRRAVSCIPDRVTALSDAMALPRIEVGDISGDVFERMLNDLWVR